ncbi:methyl-accepting chemotaxis protein [Piscinibacter sp. HJYY11]|uniref:methyl-accepting chemotaxis protein n=1 Tax=Piscinibacter sp. HJYY11 TaxID=2801333 RepID=UPI00192002AE|nr:methyl-accepting chemotaxis protein [Piscinibacter sp. HJYY11]MBL0729632.1 HAMP domain-containing protein [Piscinibacter sp. HJYY11]
MKLRNQVLLYGLAGACAAALVGAIGLFSTNRLADAMAATARMGQAAQDSQSASLMLDAIRGDVQRAMLGALGRDKKQIGEAQSALAGHSDALNAALNALTEAPLSSQTKETIKKTIPVAKDYEGAAKRIVELSAADTAAAAAVPEFQRLYNETEGLMRSQVQAIQQEGKQSAERSKGVVQNATLLVAASLLVSTVLLIGAALWLSARMAKPMAKAVYVAKALAQGDLSQPVVVEGNDETAQLLTAIDDTQKSLGSIVKSVKSSANRLAISSAEIAQGNMDLSARTERQASSLEETSSAMKELSAAVVHNAQSAQEANRLAAGASSKADEACRIVEKVAASMQVIQESSKKILEIVGLVDGIAAQTNILALNAGVEAARAGEYGRGFTVVATEVRGLAGRASKAAKDIGTLIRASNDEVNAGGALVSQSVQSMREVVQGSRRVTEIMEEIRIASEEQSIGVSEVERAVGDIDEVTQRNSALVEEMAAAAGELRGQADELVRVVSVFKVNETFEDSEVPQTIPNVAMMETTA